ncbi:S1 family peptidase [Salinactinospora qingdaonensis]|uniref:Streptogrisin C n=1 Tax=Salinactinospora qingdaonensis TaxID=702744 RepID=A0ABP7FKA6_9ACTN
MHKSPKPPVFAALSTVLLTAGVVGMAAQPAAADAASDVSPEMMSALQRDLDLTKAEADQRLEQEAQARKLSAASREAAGDAFAGSVFAADSGELTVSVTSKAAAAKVRNLGAVPELVEFSAKELDGIVADLNESSDAADSEVTGWYRDTADNSVVVTVVEGDTAAARELIAEAGVNTEAVEIEEESTRPETFIDIIGGNAYYPGPYRCSIGFAVQGGFVTAGHCGDSGTTTSSPSGTVAGSIFPYYDMGWVSAPGHTPLPLVNTYNGSYVTVQGSQEATTNSSVCRSGSTTGWHCGSIQSKNQTVRYAEGTVYGLTRTTVCAEPGDSGGSFISGSQAQGVTSGGSGNCTSGGLTFFQPVNPILNQWNLTLVTS